jgi:hypothetical protein
MVALHRAARRATSFPLPLADTFVMRRIQEIFLRKHLAYKTCFLDDRGELTQAARVVLADLAKFASVGSPTVVSPMQQQTDVPASFQRIGRGEVLSRVWKYLRLPINRLLEIEETDNG